MMVTRKREPVDISIGRRIAEFRLRAGLTQNALAQAIGRTESMVRRYEKGRAPIRAELMSKIATAVNCKRRDLLG